LIPLVVDFSFIDTSLVLKSANGSREVLGAGFRQIIHLSPFSFVLRHPLLTLSVFVTALLMFYGPLKRKTEEKIEFVNDILG